MRGKTMPKRKSSASKAKASPKKKAKKKAAPKKKAKKSGSREIVIEACKS